MTGSAPARRFQGVAAIQCLAVLFFLFYLATPSRNHVYADDSLPYALATLTGSLYAHEAGTVNVHHLAIAILHRLDRAIGLTGLGDFPACSLVFHLYVAGAALLALSLVGRLALRWFGSPQIALLAMLATAGTYGFWSYSITTDLYVPGVAFVLLAVDLAERSYGARRPALLLVLSALSVLGASLNHQAYALSAVPIALVLLLGRGRPPAFRARAWRAGVFLATALAAGLASFYAAFLADDWGRDFPTFLQGYAAWMKVMPTDKSLQPLTPFYALVGIARTLFFTDYVLRFRALYEATQRAFPWKAIFDDRFLIRELPTALVALFIALMGIAAAVLALGIARGAARVVSRPVAAPGYWMLGGWVLVQTVFFSWWEPTSNEFWIWLMPCLALLATGVAIGSGDGPPRVPALAWGFAAALFAINAPAVSRYWSRANCVYAINKDYLARVRPNDLVVTSETFAIIGEVEQMSRASRPGDGPPTTVRFAWGDFDSADPRLRRALDAVRASGGTVYVDPTLAMPERAELNALAFLRERDIADVDGEMSRLETECEARGIPLVGVRRKGGEETSFRERPFRGYLRWISG